MSWSAFRTFTDLHAYHAAFRDMRATSSITGRGNFRADFTTVQLDRLSLQGHEETLPRTAYSGLIRHSSLLPSRPIRDSKYTSMASKWCRARSSCSARHTKGIFVSFHLVDRAPSLSRMRMLRLPARR